MKKKVLLGAVAAPLVLLMTGCFGLQGFVVLKPALAPGKSTKARFTAHPLLNAKTPPYSNAYQYVLIGFTDGTPSGNPAVTVKKAKWGTNGTFGGPFAMAVSPGLAGAIDGAGACTNLGYDFSGGSGQSWKGFMTPNKVNDRQKVGTSVTIDVGITAKLAATSGDFVGLAGVTGVWIDSSSSGVVGVPDSADEFDCTGNANTFVNIT
jgi:hypothetical protein